MTFFLGVVVGLLFSTPAAILCMGLAMAASKVRPHPPELRDAHALFCELWTSPTAGCSCGAGQ